MFAVAKVNFDLKSKWLYIATKMASSIDIKFDMLDVKERKKRYVCLLWKKKKDEDFYSLIFLLINGCIFVCYEKKKKEKRKDWNVF